MAAFIAISEAVGPLILMHDSLNAAQRSVAKVMALTAVVRNHTSYAVIRMEDLLEVCRLTDTKKPAA